MEVKGGNDKFLQILVAMEVAGGIIRAPFLQGFWKRNCNPRFYSRNADH